jgi:hypothetical protein
MILGETGILSGNYRALRISPHGQTPQTIPIDTDPDYPLAHHGGYGPMYEHWYQVIRNGVTPRAGANIAFENLLTAYAAQAAMDRATVLTRDEYLREMAIGDSQ